MDAEAPVLARDHRKRKVARHGLERHEAILERPTPEHFRHHHRGDWGVHEAEGDDGEEQARHDEQDH
jgi:hypothetical protein